MLQLLCDPGKGGILHLHDLTEGESSNSTVKDVLLSKHPQCNPVHSEILMAGSPPDVHPITFDAIDGALIRSVALRP